MRNTTEWKEVNDRNPKAESKHASGILESTIMPFTTISINSNLTIRKKMLCRTLRCETCMVLPIMHSNVYQTHYTLSSVIATAVTTT